MKKIKSHVLLKQLTSDVEQVLLQAEKLRNLDDEMLHAVPMPGKWNIAQVVEHLNFYSRFYLVAIQKKISTPGSAPQEYFTPGWFGNYFTKMMQPKDESTVSNKMKTMKNAIPPPDIDADRALTQFISDQQTLLRLLKESESVNIGKIRIPTSLTKLITLSLGDTFRFFIAHEQRHMVQINNILKSDAVSGLHRKQAGHGI